jgi:putative ABC transport system ATP-binding protein
MSAASGDGSALVRLERVSKIHRDEGRSEVRALDRVSLSVPRGTFLAVTGASGSGKSTLLSLIAGLDTPTAGEIVIENRFLSRMSDDEITVFRRRRIGIVFQFFNLLPTLTVCENVALPLLLDGRRPRDIRARVEELVQRVGLGHRLGHRADELSGGEMQRVAIARALVTDPVLLLADEPTGNLDSRTGEQILRMLSEINERDGHTVILVTHDARAAARGDRLICLRDGRIVDQRHGRTLLDGTDGRWEGAATCA